MPDLIKSWERRYIRNVCRGQKRTNLLVNVHYRVYPKTVEYYGVSDLDHEYYAVQPDERENLQQGLAKNHFWNL